MPDFLDREIGTRPPVEPPAVDPTARPEPVEASSDGTAASAETAELIKCPSCAVAKPPGEMSSISDDCLKCEARKKEKDRWADLRANGKAGFVKFAVAKHGVPFSRGRAVMYCLLCDRLLVGRRDIDKHARRCTRK